MPNNSKARRDKNEKKSRRRESPPLDKQVPSESVESFFLSRSSANSGFQGDDDEFTWESVVEEAALDNSFSSSPRLPSSAAPKETRKEARRRKRREDLKKELEDEFDVTLSDDSSDKEDSLMMSIGGTTRIWLLKMFSMKTNRHGKHLGKVPQVLIRISTCLRMTMENKTLSTAQRKISLSPTQFLESKATGPLRGSRAMQQ
jgi:hypothetical protein